MGNAELQNMTPDCRVEAAMLLALRYGQDEAYSASLAAWDKAVDVWDAGDVIVACEICED